MHLDISDHTAPRNGDIISPLPFGAKLPHLQASTEELARQALETIVGWIILAIILFLLLFPFLIPLRIKVRLDDTHHEIALFYGLFQFYPEGKKRLAELRQKAKRFLRIPVLVLKTLWRGIMFLLQGIILLFRFLFTPFRAIARGLRKRKQAAVERERTEGLAAEQLSSPSSAEGPSADERSDSADSDNIEEREEGHLGKSSDTIPGMESHSDFSGAKKEDGNSDSDSPWDLGDEETTGSQGRLDGKRDDLGPKDEPTSEDHFRKTDSSARSGEETGNESGFFSRLKNPFRRAAGIRDKIDEIIGLIQKYGPLAKIILRRFLLFLQRCMNAFRFRTFDARYSLGGDPATLGALLGWHHALGAAIHPSIPHHVIFEPDFDSQELAPQGTLDLELVIWPYRFILPTLALIVTLPWWSAFKLYRKHRRQQSA